MKPMVTVRFHHCLSFKIKIDMKLYRNSRALSIEFADESQ